MPYEKKKSNVVFAVLHRVQILSPIAVVLNDDVHDTLWCPLDIVKK